MRAKDPLALLRPAVRSMQGYTPGEQVHGCVKLNTNECAYPPGPRVAAALASFPASRLRVYSSPRSDGLRDAAAKVYGVARENVLVGNGSDDLLTIIVRAFVDAGETIATPHPTYALYDTLAALQGARMEHVDYGPSWELPEALGEGSPKLIFVCSPNNPSATSTPRARLLDLVARRSDSIVVVDEAYADFARESVLPDLHAHPNLIVLRTFSKSYALAGARLGLLFAHAGLVAELMKVKDSYNVDAIAEALGIAALADVEYLDETVAKTLAERAWLEEKLGALGFTWPTSTANFLLVDVGGDARAEALYAALKAKQILVRHWKRPRLSSCLRITVGTRAQNEQLVAELTRARAAGA